MSIREFISGNVYEAEVRYICKKMAGGGCVIRTICILSFTDNNVEVSYHTEVRCTPKEREANYSDPDEPGKQYTWSEINETITIKGFDKYGTFIYKEDQLISQTASDEDLIFIKQKA